MGFQNAGRTAPDSPGNGPLDAHSLAACCNSPNNAVTPKNQAVKQARQRLRRQRLVSHLHRLGPSPLFHFLAESSGAPASRIPWKPTAGCPSSLSAPSAGIDSPRSFTLSTGASRERPGHGSKEPRPDRAHPAHRYGRVGSLPNDRGGGAGELQRVRQSVGKGMSIFAPDQKCHKPHDRAIAGAAP
jgi:hypothetical protein